MFAKTERTGLQFPAAGSSALESLTVGNYQEVGARLEFTPAAIGARRPHAGVSNREFHWSKLMKNASKRTVARQRTRLLVAPESIRSSNKCECYVNSGPLNPKKSRSIATRSKKAPISYHNKLDLLLRAEERRGQAQRTYYQAVCEYNKSISAIHYWKGSLLDLNSIAMEEGPWPQKSLLDADELAQANAPLATTSTTVTLDHRS